MNTRHLSLFAHVAKSGSMSKTAEELRISQPAISAQIKRLEDDLGVPLFASHGRGIRLTDAGNACLEYAEVLLGVESQLRRSMEEFHEGKRGRIIVAASGPLGTYLMPRFLSSFQQTHSGIELELQLHSDEEIARLVLNGQVDIGISLLTPKEHLSLRVTRFVEDVWIGIQSLTTTDSLQVFVSKDSHLPNMDELNASWVILDNIEAVKQFVLQGIGRGIVLRSSVTREMQSGLLKQWDDYNPQYTTTSIITRPAEKLSISLWVFMRHLQQVCMTHM